MNILYGIQIFLNVHFFYNNEYKTDIIYVFQLKSTRINGMVTSIQKINNEELLMAGTIKCELYLISLKDLSFALLITCHTSAIYDLTFPQ